MNWNTIFLAALIACGSLLCGCATQPPNSELGTSASGSFTVVASSGDHWKLDHLDVGIDGATGSLSLWIKDSGNSRIPLKLVRCTLLADGTVDALSWKSSFLDGQEADVIRCDAVGSGFAKHFAAARARSGALAYQPPILARLLPNTHNINSEQGRLFFLWDGSGTAAYAVSKQ
ncbi:hypothetical protein GCT13_33535 [Paraburkholderia sp. CNPSo 3157]|uniref:Lipoprotein n=1 Tax=Paraburkholderia franconis TaxID=2654983 RepID=A0A7X1NGP2_9BURK|nr:hypothetical protein [Paraburkholderia franconis]MPW21663.1 hypothetical protein [Paraburkholderia franconis]